MNVVVATSLETPARRLLSVADIRRMVEAGIIAEDENFELIDGEMFLMSPKGNQHEVVKSALNRLLAIHSPRHLRLAIETSLYLDDLTFLEPDFCLYPKSILPEDVRGTDVLLAIEVSVTSMSYDRGLKARIYARHGVQELWVVDAAKRETWLHRRPSDDGNWGSVERVAPDAKVSPAALPDIKIVMADLD